MSAIPVIDFGSIPIAGRVLVCSVLRRDRLVVPAFQCHKTLWLRRGGFFALIFPATKFMTFGDEIAALRIPPPIRLFITAFLYFQMYTKSSTIDTLKIYVTHAQCNDETTHGFSFLRGTNETSFLCSPCLNMRRVWFVVCFVVLPMCIKPLCTASKTHNELARWINEWDTVWL